MNSLSRRLVVTVVVLIFAGLAAWLLLSGPRPTAGKSVRRSTAAPAPTPTPVTALPPTSLPAALGSSSPPSASGTDFAAALDAARRIGNPRQRSPEIGRLLRSWLAENPEAALAYLRQWPRGGDFTQALFLTLDTIAQRDPGRALLLAGELATTREEQMIYASLFAQLAARDINTAVRRLAEVPAGEARDNAIRAVGDMWARTNFDAALAWGQGISRPEDRALAIESVISSLVATDPMRAIQLAQRSLAGAPRDRTLLAALRQLAEIDAPAAAEIASALPAGEVQRFIAPTIARALAAKDPAAALEWIKTVPGEANQRIALNNVLELWAAQDPAAAGRYVVAMSPGAGRSAAITNVARVMGASAPQLAVTWVQSLGDPAVQASANVMIGSAWAERDPSAAAAWAMNLPASSGRDETLKGALSYWALHDAGAAQSFVGSLPAEMQGSAAASLAPALAQKQPEAALLWAQSLSNANARDAATVAAYERWRGNAPAAAESWLASANLPADVKTKLRR